ncbi:MAG: DHH family phosphoesterase [Fimbriimonadaceae bacterium]
MQDQFLAFQRFIERADRLLIGTHQSPDGDALGSSLAFCLYLQQIGKPFEFLCSDPAPQHLSFLPGVNLLRTEPSGTEFSYGVVLDLPTLSRIGRVREPFEKLSHLAILDHHVRLDQPVEVLLHDQSASATAVIVARYLKTIGAQITPDIATCLLTGIITDTGSFRFRNVNSECLSLASELVDAGGDFFEINDSIFQSRPISSASLQAKLLTRIQYECDERIAWSFLTFQDFEETGASDDQTEGFANELLSLQPVEIAAFIREASPGRIQVSLRSRNGIDVSAAARDFGGGGHLVAAGCTFSETTLSSAAHQLIERLKLCLESC